jgi:hypothetical protein
MLFRWRATGVAVVAAVVAALAIIPAAYASGESGCKHPGEGTYTSYPDYVEKCSGPNESRINHNDADNETGEGVCNAIWRYNGGTSYTQMSRSCDDSVGKEVPYEISIGEAVDGHGTSARPYEEFEYILYGAQWYEA